MVISGCLETGSRGEGGRSGSYTEGFQETFWGVTGMVTTYFFGCAGSALQVAFL